MQLINLNQIIYLLKILIIMDHQIIPYKINIMKFINYVQVLG